MFRLRWLLHVLAFTHRCPLTPRQLPRRGAVIHSDVPRLRTARTRRGFHQLLRSDDSSGEDDGIVQTALVYLGDGVRVTPRAAGYVQIFTFPRR